MAALNQCTFAFSSDTPLVQYYRVCITCTRNNTNSSNGENEEEVVICINCSAICHDGHKLSDVLRQKMFCHCSVKDGGSHCRVMPRDRRRDDYDDESDTCSGCGDMSHSHSHGHGHGSSSSSKKRKYNALSMGHDHCHSHGHEHESSIVGKLGTNHSMETGIVCANNNSHSLILWSRFSKHDQQKKVLQQSHLMNIDEANRLAKETFVKANPWGLSEQAIYNDPHYSMSLNKWNHLQLKMMRIPRQSDIPEIWEVGVDSADNFLEEFCSFHSSSVAKENGGASPSVGNASKKMPAVSTAAPIAAASSSRVSTPAPTKTPNKKVVLAEVHSEDEDERVLFSTKDTAENISDETVPDLEESGKKKRGCRPKKEAGAPKGPIPSYMIYCNMTRAEHQVANPAASMIELTKIIANHWKTLSPEEKSMYESLAKADKIRYNTEMEEYKRKKADGTFIPPEVVSKPKGKPGPKPKVKDATPIGSISGQIKQEHTGATLEDIDADSHSGGSFGSENRVEEEEEIMDESDHNDGAASDFEDL